MRQGNLNPEIEEKLLNLQRYQEKQAKGEPFDPTAFAMSYTTRAARVAKSNVYDSPDESEESEEEISDDDSLTPKSARKRGVNEDDDDEWVLDTPRKYIKKAERIPVKVFSVEKKPEQKIIVKTTDPGTNQIKKNIIFCNRASENINNQVQTFVSEQSPEKALLATKIKMKVAQKTGGTDEQQKLQGQLLKHKETLKKIILKKRETLEKELQNEIQKELSADMAIHIKNICATQESIVEPKKEPSKYMRKK